MSSIRVSSVLHPGMAAGEVLVLDEPLSFWGGLDLETGRVVDAAHPQCGEPVAGRILVMESGRGSSSAASALVEVLRRGTGPAAIILARPDPVLAIGAIVAADLYEIDLPLVVVGEQGFERLRRARAARVDASAGAARIEPT